MAERAVTCIIVPADVQEMDAVPSPPRAHGSIYSSVGYRAPKVVPVEADLRRAAEVLNAGERVAMLVGAGALHATDEVIEVAELLGAGVAKALLGRAALPDDLPFVTGQIGLLGSRPSYEMMMGCDTLLMVGSSFPYSEFLPAEGQARGVQIDIDGKMLGIRYPMEVHLEGDSAETLRALAPLLERKADRSWREQLEKSIEEWWQVVEQRSMSEADPINPERVLWELSPRLPDQLHHQRGLGQRRQLVRPQPEDPSRHEGDAVGHARHDVPGCAVCARGQVQLSRAGLDRAGRRRRHADARATTA